MSTQSEQRFGLRAPWLLLMAFAWLVGAWLRLHQLPAQILADDELHAILYLRDANDPCKQAVIP